MKKRILALLLASLLVLALAACGAPAQETAPAEGNQEAASAENAAQETASGDAIKTVVEGMTFTIPAEFQDLVDVRTQEDGYLFTVAEKASVE